MGSRERIVICGGGAIGAAIIDWCRGSSLDRLARRSFELHAELSSELGNPWGYRRLTTYVPVTPARAMARANGAGVRGSPTGTQLLGRP
jgi:hypothetical protein